MAQEYIALHISSNLVQITDLSQVHVLTHQQQIEFKQERKKKQPKHNSTLTQSDLVYTTYKLVLLHS